MSKILIYYEQKGYGGVDTHLAHLINNWPEISDQFVVLTNPDNKGVDFLKEKISRCNVDVEFMGTRYPENPRSFVRKLFDAPPTMFRFVVNFFKKFRVLAPEIMIADNGGYPGGLTNFLAVIIARATRPSMPVFLLLHHAPPSSKVSMLCRLGRLLADGLAIIVRCSRIPLITVSNASKEILEEETPLAGFHVIYNGLDVESSGVPAMNLRRQFSVPESKVIVGMIGPIDPHKGHHVLIEAFSCSKILQEKAHLLIVGRGTPIIIEELKKRALQFNITKQVTFCGFIAGEPCGLISQFDVLAMPTTDFEGFGYSMAEAMAIGLPVVASAVGAIPEVIQDGVTGILVPPNNPQSLQESLEKLAGDSSLREKIGRNAKRHILGNFSAKKMASEYYNFMTREI